MRNEESTPALSVTFRSSFAIPHASFHVPEVPRKEPPVREPPQSPPAQEEPPDDEPPQREPEDDPEPMKLEMRN